MSFKEESLAKQAKPSHWASHGLPFQGPSFIYLLEWFWIIPEECIGPRFCLFVRAGSRFRVSVNRLFHLENKRFDQVYIIVDNILGILLVDIFRQFILQRIRIGTFWKIKTYVRLQKAFWHFEGTYIMGIITKTNIQEWCGNGFLVDWHELLNNMVCRLSLP